MTEPTTTTKFKIHWRNLKTSKKGYGTRQFDEAEANKVCAELNAEYPDFEHSVVPCSQDGTPHPEVVEAPQPAPFLPLTDAEPFPFGVHKGTPMGNVPSDYLDWIDGLAWLPRSWPQVADYIERNRKAINQDLGRAENE